MLSPTELSPERYVQVLRTDAERMIALADEGLDAGVPACPGWTVGDALRHTAEVYEHKVLCMRLGRPPEREERSPAPEDPAEAVHWFRQQLQQLLDELTSRSPEQPSWTWHEAHQTVGFWHRRMAQETAVHRVDVESGFDQVRPVDDDLAVDGIDEVLDWFMGVWAEDVGPDGPGRGTVLVRTGDHAWRLALSEAQEVELSRDPGPADAVISGEPSELLLWLWGRRPDSAVTREGDDELLRGFRERLRIVTQ